MRHQVTRKEAESGPRLYRGPRAGGHTQPRTPLVKPTQHLHERAGLREPEQRGPPPWVPAVLTKTFAADSLSCLGMHP